VLRFSVVSLRPPVPRHYPDAETTAQVRPDDRWRVWRGLYCRVYGCVDPSRYACRQANLGGGMVDYRIKLGPVNKLPLVSKQHRVFAPVDHFGSKSSSVHLPSIDGRAETYTNINQTQAGTRKGKTGKVGKI